MAEEEISEGNVGADGLTVRAAVDHRFGTLQFDVRGLVRLQLRQLIDALNLPPEELAAIMEDRYKWTDSGPAGIEPARLRTLEKTDWTGKTAVDVGGYDGFAAEIALKHGATRAVCLDSHQYEHYGWEEKKKPGVEYVTGDVMDWHEPMDVVIAYNILYHTHHIWRMLGQLRRITKPEGEMLYCGLFRYHAGAWMYVYLPRECNSSDETVYFGPSLEATERLFTQTGWDFQQEGLSFDRCVYRCKPTPGWVEKHPEPGD